ncbi:hypothetical protein RHGRI_008290 [Rhododendron griersonianum]|uniref:Derlin n=1 Tax=Rhododendron griersonianum TaxID=479676 RepID=A0AAV6L213_9ERIC|nr:hypothetical protein RHGRI_008290 [Rhododendron griersonianum]
MKDFISWVYLLLLELLVASNSALFRYYQDLPPVAKAYGVLCLMTSGAYELGLYNHQTIALFYGPVIKRFQVWRLVTNFFFLGPFSFTFAFRLLLIARHGVQLERGPFDKRTADYLWMYIFGAFSLLAMALIPFLSVPFMGASLVFMIVYVWGREFPNERMNIHGLFQLKGFYLPWYMLGIDLILGNPLKPDLLGMAAGHLYYFLTVLYPLSGGRFSLKTPHWVHKLVAYWGVGFQQNAPVTRNTAADVAFQGRSRRLGGTRTSASTQAQPSSSEQEQQNAAAQPNQANDGVAFRGRSYRLDGRR